MTSISSSLDALLRLAVFAVLAAALSACQLESHMAYPSQRAGTPDVIIENSGGGFNSEVARYAVMYRVPESLIRRIIVRESNYNAAARNGPYWGLMQIRYDTARSMGYEGSPAGLLNADTNLRYGAKYLAGAYMVAHGDPEKAVSFYATGYYYDARRLGLLEEVGLKRGK